MSSCEHLIDAVARGDTVAVRQWLECGADPDTMVTVGASCAAAPVLAFAVTQSHHEAVTREIATLLLAYGADADRCGSVRLVAAVAVAANTVILYHSLPSW